jgi:Ca2+-binding RTX toxin-like protein
MSNRNSSFRAWFRRADSRYGRRLRLEQLESRVCPAFSAKLIGTELVFTGTPGDDHLAAVYVNAATGFVGFDTGTSIVPEFNPNLPLLKIDSKTTTIPAAGITTITIWGFAGDDKVSFDNAKVAGNNNLARFAGGSISHLQFYGSTGNDNLVSPSSPALLIPPPNVVGCNIGFMGDSGSDILVGSDSRECFIGGAGGDSAEGNGGNDNLMGNGGSDTLFGGEGNDYLNAGGVQPIGAIPPGEPPADRRPGMDTLNGGPGRDELLGDDVGDNLFGEAGSDYIDAGDDDDFIKGGDGDDQIYGHGGSDTILGEGGDDTIRAGTSGQAISVPNPDDEFEELAAVPPNTYFELVIGGGGWDWINVELADGSAYVDAGDGPDTVTGSDFADKIFGGASMDWLSGGKGNDEIFGNDGDDFLWGDSDGDQIFGGSF